MGDDKDRNSDIDADAALWAAVVKDVEPLKGRDKLVVKTNVAAKNLNNPKQTIQSVFSDIPVKNRDAAKGRDVDAGTLRKLRAGQIAIEERLDLHGMNRGEARQALIRTLVAAQAAGKRCVLVITGKGKSGKGAAGFFEAGYGILKRNVPEWFNEAPLRDIVLSAQPAVPRHGGGGALYVYLRRLRA